MRSAGRGASWARRGLWSTAAAAALSLALSVGSFVEAATPKTRVAVIVGNGAYERIEGLPNALRDADLVSDHLKTNGYQVLDGRDLTRPDFLDFMARVQTEIPHGSDVVFFFAGHGVQVASVNYLLPIDAEISSLVDLPLEAVTLNSLIEVIGARADVKVFFLDSCRNNPFVGMDAVASLDDTRSAIDVGFTFQSAPVNSVIAFSTAPGAVAFEGTGDNSPFTEALVRNSSEGVGIELPALLSRVRRDLYEVTGGLQVSWQSSSLISPFALIERPQSEPELTSVVAVSAPPPVAENIRIAGRYERSVDLGIDIKEAVGDAMLTLASAPSNGFVRVTGEDGETRTLYDGAEIAPEELASLVYAPRFSPQTVRGLARAPALDRVELTTSDNRLAVEIALELDACDRLAGSNLDPQGVVGNAGADNFQLAQQAVSALEACRAAVAAEPDNPRFKYQLSRALRANQLFEESDRYLTEALEAGYIRANNNVASAVSRARVLQDGTAAGGMPEEALAYLRRGHELGDPVSSYALGRQLLRYGATRAIQREGYEILLLSYEAGLTEALAELGFYYLSTDTDLKAPERGLAYLQEAAALGNTSGQHSLAIALAFDEYGVPQDPEQAETLFRQAIEAYHPVAPRNLGRLLFTSAASAEDYREILDLYDLSLTRGDPWGGILGADLVSRGVVPNLTDADLAWRAARAAVVRGDAGNTAQGQLDGIPEAALDTATQQVLKDMGYAISVDGDFGPRSRATLEDALAAYPVDADLSTPRGRLLTAARMAWKTGEVRPELF